LATTLATRWKVLAAVSAGVTRWGADSRPAAARHGTGRCAARGVRRRRRDRTGISGRRRRGSRVPNAGTVAVTGSIPGACVDRRLIINAADCPGSVVTIPVRAVEHTGAWNECEHPEVGIEIPARAVPRASRIFDVLGRRDI